jgi:hypothetical protein
MLLLVSVLVVNTQVAPALIGAAAAYSPARAVFKISALAQFKPCLLAKTRFLCNSVFF